MTTATGACNDCGGTTAVMLEMHPDATGAPWHLCSRCWIEGVSRPALQPAARTVLGPKPGAGSMPARHRRVAAARLGGSTGEP